jgi:hypothetical protein
MNQRASAEERVEIWNSYLLMARQEVSHVLAMSPSYTRCPDVPQPAGGLLPECQHHTIAALLLCSLAIEARANHLIRELEEAGRLTKVDAETERWRSTKDKWFRLPALAQSCRKAEGDRPPHQAVGEVCGYRNEIVHVKYDKLSEILARLPSPRKVLCHWHNLLQAVDDMNSIVRGKPCCAVTFDCWNIDP